MRPHEPAPGQEAFAEDAAKATIRVPQCFDVAVSRHGRQRAAQSRIDSLTRRGDNALPMEAPDNQKTLLREFKRILRPGGLLLISDYPLQTDARNVQRCLQLWSVAREG